MGDSERNAFCKGAEPDKCGCIRTDGFKQSALHIETIIEECRKLPLEEADIRTFLRTIGLYTRCKKNTDEWEFHGPLYRVYKMYREPTDILHSIYLRDLCVTFWSYTNPQVACKTQVNVKDTHCGSTLTTIKNEIKIFTETYPLQNHQVAVESCSDTKQQIQFLLKQLNSRRGGPF